MKELLKDNSLKAVTVFCSIECICVLLTILSDFVPVLESLSPAISLFFIAVIVVSPISRFYSILQILHILLANKGAIDSKTTKSIVYIAAANICVMLTYFLLVLLLSSTE